MNFTAPYGPYTSNLVNFYNFPLQATLRDSGDRGSFSAAINYTIDDISGGVNSPLVLATSNASYAWSCDSPPNSAPGVYSNLGSSPPPLSASPYSVTDGHGNPPSERWLVSSTITFSFKDPGGGGGGEELTSSLTVGGPEPEPSTLALLATATVSLLAYAWRRRQTAS